MQCSSMFERGIVDAVMVILRPVEDDGAALERIRVLRIAEIAVAEFLADHRQLHHRIVEEIAFEHDKSGIFAHRLAKG